MSDQEAAAPINIDEIMQQIRQQIIAKRAAVSPDGSPGYSDIVLTGKRLPPEFYEHLYRARIALDDYAVPVFVSKSTVPIIGGLIDWLRGKFHELVVYYVNQSATRQVSATSHLLRALSLLAEDMEEAADQQ